MSEQTKSAIVRFGLRFFAVVLALSAPAAFHGTVLQLIEARASSSWPTSEGVVVKSEIEKEARLGKSSSRPKIAYRYTVQSRELTGDRITPSDLGYGLESWAQSIVDEYPVGARVVVHYNPTLPERALLKPGVSWSTWFMLCIPAAMLGFAFFCWREAKHR